MKKFVILKSISIIKWLKEWKRRYSKGEKEKKSLYEKKENIITEKVGIIETRRKIIKRNMFTILIIILIRCKRSTEVIMIKTKTKTIIIIIGKLFIIMT